MKLSTKRKRLIDKPRNETHPRPLLASIGSSGLVEKANVVGEDDKLLDTIIHLLVLDTRGSTRQWTGGVRASSLAPAAATGISNRLPLKSESRRRLNMSLSDRYTLGKKYCNAKILGERKVEIN